MNIVYSFSVFLFCFSFIFLIATNIVTVFTPLATSFSRHVPRSCRGMCQSSPCAARCPRTSRHRISPARAPDLPRTAPARRNSVVGICRGRDNCKVIRYKNEWKCCSRHEEEVEVVVEVVVAVIVEGEIVAVMAVTVLKEEQ